MSTTVEDLQRRMDAVEDETRRLARLIEDPESVDRPPVDGSVDEWLERLRRRKMARTSLEEVQRAMGIPPGMPRTGAKALREMMLAEGVRPEECLASREIIRMREE